MTIKFLGTSAGWPLPRLGCRCPICTSSDLRDRRTRPVVLINGSLLIDAGPDIYWQLIKEDVSKLRAVLITHAHPDHILGFWDLSHLYNVRRPLDLIVTQETLNGIKKSYQYPLTPLFKPQVIRPLEVFETDHLKLMFFPVEHGHRPCFGVKLKGEKLVVYVPDVKKIPRRYRKLCRDVHLAILGGSSLARRGQAKGHESILEGIEIGRELKAKQVYFTHIGHITGSHEELVFLVQEKGGRNFYIAYDGLSLTL